MRFDPAYMQELVFGAPGGRRFTQDSPILPDVWREYAAAPGDPVDLLLTPHIKASAGAVGRKLRQDLREDQGKGPEATRNEDEGEDDAHWPGVAYNRFNVVVRLDFDQLVRHVLPMTSWWRRRVQPRRRELAEILRTRKNRRRLAELLEAFRRGQRVSTLTAELLWMTTTVGALAWAHAHHDDPEAADPRYEDRDGERGEGEGQLLRPDFRQIVDSLRRPFDFWARTMWRTSERTKGGETRRRWLDDDALADADAGDALWQINRNRPAATSDHSVLTVKGDAALQLFEITCRDITWAVIDSGVDASHPAFCTPWPGPGGRSASREAPSDDEDDDLAARLRRSRVRRTFDFTRIRHLLNPDNLEEWNRHRLPAGLRGILERNPDLVDEELLDLKRNLLKGRQIDWGLLEPFLEVPHDDAYEIPDSEHGTHVAGILGAWGAEPSADAPTAGMCPDLQLYDLRVLRPAGPAHGEDGAEGGDSGVAVGDEFTVISALQFLGYLNAHRDYLVVHGANLSLSIRHEVESYACGATPVCEEADRLMSSGVVVVAAAGNQGFHKFATADGMQEGYLTLSITDPGNAQKVITVGATHRSSPHAYGVSYFSSRGPTGDGRLKPDLVAPGEKIWAPVPNEGWEAKDGTSMAAPHVSGAAALLMARHTELMGQGRRIKDILCRTATDLGRERYFQGHGLVDVLRALQSV